MRNLSFLFFFVFSFLTSVVYACDSCLLGRSGRDQAAAVSESEDGKFNFQYWFERQDWEYIDPHVAHELHHDGHHLHVKTNEDIHHFSFGYQWTDDFATTVDAPYVRRSMLDIENHAYLGQEYTAEGLGDMTVSAAYDVWKASNQKIGILAGVKLPTGGTDETDPHGNRFEPEMQPGTGSDDYHFGGVYRVTFASFDITANAVYVWKTEGAQEFKFGDVFSTTVYADYVPSQDSLFKDLRPGVVLSFQNEARHEDAGEKSDDSGGQTIFLGPELSYTVKNRVKVFGNVLLPVYQNLGGYHQEIDAIWNAGVKVDW